MRFQALSIGVEVPSHSFSGTVHSVFRQAYNVRLESNRLVALLPSEKSNVPHGIRLNTSSQPVSFDLLRVGQPVACRGGILRINSADFSVDLRTAHLWHIDLKGLHIDLRWPTQAQSWAVAWSELKTSPRRSGLSRIMEDSSLPEGLPATSAASGVLLQHSAYAIPSLLRATRNLQLDDAMTSIKPIIGLGPGLTPSGDDFLVGYFAGLWCTAGSNPSRMRFLSALGSELSHAAQNTNEISGAYLQSAANGYVSEPIATLALQLKHANNTSSVKAATQTALQVGHTSGSDGVMGLLLGCTAWRPVPSIKFQ